MDNKEKKQILDYIDSLNLLKESKQELLELLSSEKYEKLFNKLEFYTNLEFKKDEELERLQEKVSKINIEEIEAKEEETANQFAEDLVMLEDIQDTDIDTVLDDRYADLEDQIERINDDVLSKITKVQTKYRKLAEEEEIEDIKNKLK